ncbi:hypothetical protein [Persephonella sp.]
MSGIDTSQIFSVQVSNSKNNIYRTATIETVDGVSLPQEITIEYAGSEIFWGRLINIDSSCGRRKAFYKSQTCNNVDQDIYVLPYWHLARLTSPGLIKKVNDITGRVIFNDKTALVPMGTGGVTDPNPFYTFKWENYWFFVDKASALNKNFWKPFDPVARSSSADSIYQQYFGGLSDEQFAYGACFVLYRKMVSGQTEWWQHIATIYEFRTIRFHTDTKVIVPRGTKYRNITFNCNGGYGTPPFCVDIEEKTIETTSDLFKLPEINAVINTNTVGRLFNYVQIPENSTALEIVKKYAVNVSLKIDKFGQVIGTDVENIRNAYTLDKSVIFDYTLPEPVRTGVSFYLIDIDEDSLKKYVRTGNILVNRCDEEVIRIERDDVDFSDDTYRIAKQEMLNRQRTGRIRTVLLPDLDLYHRISFLGRQFRVVSFSHTISRSGAFSDIEIAEEV